NSPDPEPLPERPTEPDSAADPEPQPEPSTHRPRRGLWIGIGLVALVAIAIAVSRSGKSADAAKAAAKARAQAAIPVVVAEAKVADFPVYLNGLGTVTPLSTVTVRSRVDGELQRVDFREGQIVKEGEVLAQIDPRPFQVQLTQAEGQLAKDQAALVSQ